MSFAQRKANEDQGPIAKSSDAERQKVSSSTGGEPLLDYGRRTPYLDYEHIDTLLSIQDPLSGTHDEMCFYIMGQVIELEFKLVHHEILEQQRLIRADDVRGALNGFLRIYRLIETLIKNWEVLSTLTPNHFNAFRDYLGTASGFGSYMYRHIEFALGNKNERLLNPHKNVPHIFPEMRAAFEAPSLYDDVIRLLDRAGFAIDHDQVDRDWTKPYAANQSVEDAWVLIYREPSAYPDLYALAERLVDLSQRLRHWRYHHLVTVERMIGFKPGTGGTAGVQWLRNIVEHEFFPELWSARTKL